MLSSLSTKLALKKVGLPSNALDFSSSSQPAKLTSRKTDTADDEDASSWATGWMSLKALPLTVHPWLSPPPPPVKVAASVPRIGEPAPRDFDGKLQVGRGRGVLVVFLRCVGCAFAQKTFLALRTLANRHRSLSCIAISHASATATHKWLDLLGGAWNVSVIIDQDRAIYAAWGLGTAGVWYLLHPACQAQGWREDGWLGDKVAQAVQRRASHSAKNSASNYSSSKNSASSHSAKNSASNYSAKNSASNYSSKNSASNYSSNSSSKYSSSKDASSKYSSKNSALPPDRGEAHDDIDDEDEDGVSTLLGNKWQETGAFAIDGRGIVIWGGKAARADDVMDLEEGARLLCM